ncbi:MAG TPA: o-succinylbenzoate synthase [Gemmatimonadales bacterium]
MTFTITKLCLHDIALPLKEPFRISSGVTTERRIMLVQLTEGDGTVGWGECVAGEAPNYSPETVDTCRLAIREWLAPLVLGHPLAAAAALHGHIDGRLRGHRMAKAAVEMAAWALEAERMHVSLASLLGGERPTIPAGISLGIQPNPAALAAKACEARDRGYRRIKLKVAPGRDVDYVAAVREAVGPEVTLSVDANAAYTLADAEHLARLDAFGLAMIEQPLEGEDLRRHAALQQRLSTPLCLDESITSVARVEDMIALGSGRIVNIKPGRVGGLTVAKGIHDLCAANGIPVWCGGMLESGIGRAHNVALASLPNFTLPGDLSPSARYWARDIVTPEWTMSADGLVRVPRDVPGIGVTVDLDRIDDLTSRREEHTA